MKKWIVGLTLTVLVSGMCAHGVTGPDGAYDPMPGKNRIEREINWAWKMLPGFLKACSLSPDCKLNTEQQQIARAISLQDFKQDQIVFVSENFNPDMFKLNSETHRLAVTSNSFGSPIYINSDRYQKNGKGLGIAFWMGILTHELMHHQGTPDDARRIPDTIGALIANAAQSLLVEIAIPEDSGDITAVILNPPRPQSSEVLNFFPEGLRFFVFKADSDVGVDDVATTTANYLSPICPEGQRSAYVAVAPEAVSIGSLGDTYRATMSLISNAFCFDKANWKVEQVSSGYNNLFTLKKENGVLKMDIYGSSSWGVNSPSDGRGAFRNGTVIDLKIPTSVSAGSDLVIEAKVQAPPGLKVIGCGAFLGEWTVPNYVSPLIVVPETCELKKIGTDLYTMSMRKKILASTPTQDLDLRHLCFKVPLEEGDSGDCIPAYPLRKTFVKIVNASSLKALAITDVQLNGNRLKFVIRNAAGLEYLFLSVGVVDGEKNGFAVNIGMTVGPIPGAYESIDVRQVGPDIVVDAVLKLINISDVQMVSEQLEQITVLTKDLRYQVLDVTNQNLRVQP